LPYSTPRRRGEASGPRLRLALAMAAGAAGIAAGAAFLWLAVGMLLA